MAIDSARADHGDLEQLLQALRPRNALAEYHSLAGGAGLFPQFAAVVACLRPGMDCWIPFQNLERFRQFVEGLRLSVSVDCAFRELPPQARDQVIGIETLCTTHAIGVRLEDASAGDSVHAFVGVTRDVSERLCASGWYPVVVNGRLFHKPFIDHLEFGRMLGYPACCIGFFERSNNWNRTNSYAEAHLNSGDKFDHRTNCFGKNLGYSLNFHIPCRFDCPDTIGFSSRLAEFLGRTEPEYATACLELLRKPVLSLNEREIVVLDGVGIREKRVRYTGSMNLFSTPEHVLGAIRDGNVVEIRGRFVVVCRDAELVDVFECRCDSFGPHVPLLIDWV